MDNESEKFATLIKLIQDFERLDREIWGQFGNEKIEKLIYRVIEAKEKINEFLVNEQKLIIKGDLLVKLKKIRDCKGNYFIDVFNEDAQRELRRDFAQAANQEPDFVDKLFSEGTADYVDEHFYRRKNEIGFLLCNQTLPNNVLHQLNNIRECYALSLYEASIIYCRVLIEHAIYEYRCRRKLISSDTNDISSLEMALFEIKHYIRINKVPFNKKSLQDADNIRRLANDILHKKGKSPSIFEKVAYDSIKQTIYFVEELFK